jgi:2-hydroxy-6-oxonona-2,4-dienedioate hydrolase
MISDGYRTIWPCVSDLKIHTRVSTTVSPDDRAVVLVHGLGVSAEYMLPTLERLAPEFTVLAPELPGFGRSDQPTHVLDIPELADLLARWADAVGLQSAIFLGNSLGCQVIIDLAVRYPELVNTAILVGPTVDSAARTMLQQVWRGIRDLIHEPWSLWRILIRDYLRTGTWRMYRTFQFALRDNVVEKCPGLAARTLIVRGSFDTIAPTRWIDELAVLIPNATTAVIPGGTHASNYSVPDALVDIARGFLNR